MPVWSHGHAIAATPIPIVGNGVSLLVVEGDSINVSGAETAWPDQIDADLPTYTIVNLATGGAQVADLESRKSTALSQYDAANTRNLFCLLVGTNDLIITPDDNGATGLIARHASYCADVKAAGFEVLVMTILPRDLAPSTPNPSKFVLQRTAFNTSVRANYATYAARLADIGANATIGQDGAYGSPYYTSDLIHPTTLGQSIISDIVLAAL